MNLTNIFSSIPQKRSYRILFLLFLLAVINLSVFIKYAYELNDPYKSNLVEAQQIVPFYQFYFPNFAENYTDKYFLDAWAPTGFKITYTALSHIMHPRDVFHMVGLLLFALNIIFVYLISKKLFNYYIAVGTCLILAASEVINYFTLIAFPHSFSFPILAAAIYYFITNRLRAGLLCSFLGFCFYPMIGIFIITMFGLSEYILKPLMGQGFKIFSRKTVYFIICAICSVLVCLPVLKGSSSYGQRAAISDIQQFPETELHGRYKWKGDLPPTKPNFISAVAGSLQIAITGHIKGDVTKNKFLGYFILVNFCLIILGCYIGYARTFIKLKNRQSVYSMNMQLVSSFLLTMVICTALSVLLYPYFFFPERYMLYTLPLMVILYILPSIKFLFGKYFRPEYNYLLLLFGVFLALVSGNFDSKIELTDNNQNSRRDVYDFIAEQPGNALWAGWPGFGEPIDYIELVTGKRAYYLSETHQAVHKDFMLRMRARAYHLFDAYFATSIDELKTFRDESGTEYLIVNKAHFLNKADPTYQKPTYFKPFDVYIGGKIVNADIIQKPFILPSLEKDAIFDNDEFFILDLKKLK